MHLSASSISIETSCRSLCECLDPFSTIYNHLRTQADCSISFLTSLQVVRTLSSSCALDLGVYFHILCF